MTYVVKHMKRMFVWPFCSERRCVRTPETQVDASRREEGREGAVYKLSAIFRLDRSNRKVKLCLVEGTKIGYVGV